MTLFLVLSLRSYTDSSMILKGILSLVSLIAVLCVVVRTESYLMIYWSFFKNIISEKSVESIYNLYHSLKFFGNYSIEEIDNMSIPERSIFFSLLNQTLEERAKIRNSQR